MECNTSINQTEEHDGRRCKLSIFPSNHFCNPPGTANQDTLQEEPEILLQQDDFPYLKVGDVIEIFQHDTDSEGDAWPRLLLMVS